MSEPPGFEPHGQPQVLSYAAPSATVDLRTIAVRQKAVIYCILAYIVVVGARVTLVTARGDYAPFELILALLQIGVYIATAVFTFMLAIALFNVAAGIILGIVSLIPLLGFIVLLVISSRATSVLRRHGIRVGLMGAKSSQIPSSGTTPYR